MFVSVFGEFFFIVGVLVLLFVVWQMWIGDIIIVVQKNDEGVVILQQFVQVELFVLLLVVEGDDGMIVYVLLVLVVLVDGEWFGQMYIFCFGVDYNFGIYGGMSCVCMFDQKGIGVYINLKMFGEVGNFFMVGYCIIWGKLFNQFDKLQIGDVIVVEILDGWYMYWFCMFEYVKLMQMDVLVDVLQMFMQQIGEQFIMFIVCLLLYFFVECIVVYGVFESFQFWVEGLFIVLIEMLFLLVVFFV